MQFMKKSIRKIAAVVMTACLFAVVSIAQEKPKKPILPRMIEFQGRMINYALDAEFEKQFDAELLQFLELKSLDAMGFSLQGIGASTQAMGLALEGMELGLEDIELRYSVPELESLEFSLVGIGEFALIGESLAFSVQESVGVGSSRSQSDAERAQRNAERAKRDTERELRRAQRDRSRASRRYSSAKRALNKRDWERAIELFNDVIEDGGAKSDGALYWMAYAQYRMGSADEALATLQRLESEHSGSRWLNDAAALKAEIQQRGGQPYSPEDDAKEEMKELALQGMISAECERAMPVLERFLQGNQSPRLKARALFVVSQKKCPRAGEILAKFARGDSNPDIQMKAIQYLGIFGGAQNRQLLADIYSSTEDIDVRKRILRSFMVAKDKEKLLQVAREESDEGLRGEAGHQLGMLNAKTELRELYRAESSTAVKKKLLQGMLMANDAEGLMLIIREEKDVDLQLRALRNLGVCRSDKAKPFLIELYGPDQPAKVRKGVLHALFMAHADQALIDIARKETDPVLKKDAVKWLALRKSKAARDFMMEILEQ